MAETGGVTIQQAAPRSMAGIGAFRDCDALAAAIQAEFGMALPTTLCRVTAGGVIVSCLAPTRYFATAERGADLPARLAGCLDGLAAVTDQSDAWVLFILTGPAVHDVLARVVPVDLEALRVDDLALTRGSHLDLRLWRIAERSYEIAVGRSYAEDLRFALEKSKEAVLS